MLAKLKLLLGISGNGKDDLLNLVIAMAQDDFCALAGLDEYNVDGDAVVLKMACVKYNSLGSEGLNNQSYNGLSESYSGYDNDIIKSIQRFKRCKTV